MTVEFLVTTLIIVATPGTGVIYTLAAGISRGGRASVIAAVGCTLAIVPHMVGGASQLRSSRCSVLHLASNPAALIPFAEWHVDRDGHDERDQVQDERGREPGQRVLTDVGYRGGRHVDPVRTRPSSVRSASPASRTRRGP